MQKKTFHTFEQLAQHIKTGGRSFYSASQTSTVIPYPYLEKYLGEDVSWCDLSSLPQKLEIISNDNVTYLKVTGPVSWKEAKAYARSCGRDLMTSPTEELAAITAGVNTSATGERCFHFGTLRDQVIEIIYLDCNGEEQILSRDKTLDLGIDLAAYKQDYEWYAKFKNAPYPRLNFETDLLIGSEGQIGIVKSVTIKTFEYKSSTFLALKLSKWEENIEQHLKVFWAAQKLRDQFFGCEMIDSNSLSVLDSHTTPVKDADLILFEIWESELDSGIEKLMNELDGVIDPENIFEIPYNKCMQMRMEIPRKTFEQNERNKVTKKGTDVQVNPDKFQDLLLYYRQMKAIGVRYNLFGHFGDGHLHFNYMPTTEQVSLCDGELEKLYQKVFEWRGSPFAEHGIGFLKQKFIKPFLGQTQIDVLYSIKKKLDPDFKFFPQGIYSKAKDL